ncbi:sensor histidine kinase [Streptomonospora nanhaiensis]|uniref:histidine kinase n=1 Tax=Streptomonospora nanhaiensis TaxID=1323731 RepID=A0A853BPC8_9ACTN|nr:histidine kinase [Streptomonospora nanhaiensis]MBV2365708.1 sensor histidine kinase [Streptomonospora nanhaiensis]MBX9387569.1 sensor histidine kinase [Streptomonospora nanhaiensis]NYI96506.1 signal transduction histidine kinase [Streptomonospora nanhaiensis]
MKTEVSVLPAGEGGAPWRPTPLAAAAVAAAVLPLIAATVWQRLVDGPPGAYPALDIAVGVLAWAGAPVALWRPVPAALALTALALLSPAATPAATLAVLLVAQRHRLPVAAAVAAAGLAAHAVQGFVQPSGGISYGWWLLLIAAGYGAMVGWGALLRAHRALVESLRERARRAEAEQGRRVAEARMAERTRLAREMHDVLAHRLTLLATYAGALEYRPDSSPERLAHAAGVVREGVHQALEELREVIVLLRADEGAPGDDLDGPEGLRPPPAALSGLVAESRAAGTEVDYREEAAGLDRLPPGTARALYRVVQEGLTNARRHAPGRPVAVAVRGRPGDGLTASVANPLPPPGGAPSGASGTGTGLVGLTERVHLAGGRLDHGAAAGEFRLRAWLPWPP